MNFLVTILKVIEFLTKKNREIKAYLVKLEGFGEIHKEIISSNRRAP